MLLLLLLLVVMRASTLRRPAVVVWLVQKGFGKRVVLDLEGSNILILKLEIFF